MQYPEARSEQLMLQRLTPELLVYDLDRHKAFCLNTTTAGVWQKCDGQRTVSQIASELSNEWTMPVTEDLVWLALDKLGALCALIVVAGATVFVVKFLGRVRAISA